MAFLGAHVSVSGSIALAFDRGEALGCEAIQIFTRNQRTWNPAPLKEEAVGEFNRRASSSNIRTVISHASYLLNAASPDPEQLTKSYTALIDEISRCDALNIPMLVIHPGSHKGVGVSAGLDILTAFLNKVINRMHNSRVLLLLENTAGSGNSLGGRFEQLQWVMEGVEDQDRVGFCLDTAHAFAAGYDLSEKAGIRSVFKNIGSLIDLNRLHVFHLNDSRTGCGSRVDRHENIGEGRLGLPVFDFLVNESRFQEKPMILETPGGEPFFRENLSLLKKLRESG